MTHYIQSYDLGLEDSNTVPVKKYSPGIIEIHILYIFKWGTLYKLHIIAFIKNLYSRRFIENDKMSQTQSTIINEYNAKGDSLVFKHCFYNSQLC